MLQTKDIHWLAGILEGEGWFLPSTVGHTQSERIGFASTDKDVALRVQSLLRYGWKTNKGRPRTIEISTRKVFSRGKRVKDQFQVNVNGVLARAWMMTLYSLMGARRREQIRAALAT